RRREVPPAAHPVSCRANASRNGKRRRAAVGRPQTRRLAARRHRGTVRMRVVVSTPDVVGARMAGPGIRAYHFAEELAKHFDTTLVAKREDAPADFPIVERSAGAFKNADVVISQTARDLKFLRRDQKFIADLFDPQVLELRELYGNAPSARQRIHLAAEWWRLTRALRRADLLIAATKQQRKFYDQLKTTDTPWLE